MHPTAEPMTAEQFKDAAGKLNSADRVSLALTAVIARSMLRGSSMEVEQIVDLMRTAFEAHRLSAVLDYCSKQIGIDGMKKLGPKFAVDQFLMMEQQRTLFDQFRNLFEMGMAAEGKTP